MTNDEDYGGEWYDTSLVTDRPGSEPEEEHDDEYDRDYNSYDRWYA